MKFAKFLFLILLIASAGFAFAKYKFGGPTMKVSVAEKRWGYAKFSAEKFKEGSVQDRSKMTVDLIKGRSFIGKTRDEVIAELGTQDGFYFLDTFPAYIVEDGSENKQDVWQIVFALDTDFKVKDVFIHKNCCDKK